MAQQQDDMLRLLNSLLVGAERMMETVDAWETHLSAHADSEVTRRFLDQLKAEWFPASPPDSLSVTVMEKARQHVGSHHSGWPHLWGHIQRVTGTMLALAEDQGVEVPLTYLCGICHDVAKLDENEGGPSHEMLGAAFAGLVLAGRLDAEAIHQIESAILKQGEDALAHVLHDADKLDKIGAAGLLRRISTDTETGWLPAALQRVQDDLNDFPEMHFPRSRDLAAYKRAFLDWFLPEANEAVGG